MADFSDDYWTSLWNWYAEGGIGHVVAYLRTLDISAFDPKAPPRKTAAFWDIADANRSPEDAELADALDAAGRPRAVTLTMVQELASESFREWLQDRRNRRQIPHRLEAAGYVPVRADSARDGLWSIYGRRQAIYAQRELTPRDRYIAASDLIRRPRP